MESQVAQGWDYSSLACPTYIAFAPEVVAALLAFPNLSPRLSTHMLPCQIWKYNSDSFGHLRHIALSVFIDLYNVVNILQIKILTLPVISFQISRHTYVYLKLFTCSTSGNLSIQIQIQEARAHRLMEGQK